MAPAASPAASPPAASPSHRPGGAPPRPQGTPEPWQDPEAAPFIRIQHVTKTFDDVYAVDEVSVNIYQGEFFCLLGGSGCGKTTLLRMLAGFETPSAGRILIDGVDMARIPPYARPVNMMFQSYALFPHMNVEQNVAFGLHQEGMPKARLRQRVEEMLALVQMQGYGRRKPHQLSGGQRQRVALARALAKKPKVLLLDEPLAALDRKLREQTQFELVNIQEELGLTFVVVTHDQEEAMTMASRIALMNEGQIVQIGTPSEVYEYPRTRFAANFLGDVNLFEGRVGASSAASLTIRADRACCDFIIDHGTDLPLGTPVAVAIRPEKVELAPDDGTEPVPSETEAREGRCTNRLRGVIREIAYLGDVSIYHVEVEGRGGERGTLVKATMTNRTRMAERQFTWEDKVWLTWSPRSGVVLER